ncbi:hypothetical protein ACSQ67_003565 [Phaseolus vulgaris]
MAASPNILYHLDLHQTCNSPTSFPLLQPRNLLPIPSPILLVLQCVQAPKLSTTGFSTLHKTSIQRHPSSNFTSILPTFSTYQHDIPCTPLEASDITDNLNTRSKPAFWFYLLTWTSAGMLLPREPITSVACQKTTKRIGPPRSSINGNISNQPLNENRYPMVEKEHSRDSCICNIQEGRPLAHHIRRLSAGL